MCIWNVQEVGLTGVTCKLEDKDKKIKANPEWTQSKPIVNTNS